MYKAAIFDLDGTLLDTIEDLTDSMNHVLTACGFRGAHEAEAMNAFFGSGIRVAIERALVAERGGTEEQVMRIGTDARAEETPAVLDEEIDRVEEAFGAWYPAHCAIKTRPFAGILEVLEELKAQGVRLAVVSNKIDPAVRELVQVHFPGMFGYAAGVSESVRRKPAPDLTQNALSALGVRAEEAVYIGDSEVDLMTARNAGTDCISVDWGFRRRSFLEAVGATCICATPEEMKERILR